MNDIVERVAIAMAGYLHPDRSDDLWDGFLTDEDKRHYRAQARLAILAMREPTDAMCDAADWQQQSEVNAYQRAIDAALGDASREG